MRGTDDQPELSMLACEKLTSRAVLPIVLGAEHRPELRGARFTSRAVAWTGLAHLPLPEAVRRLELAERWAGGATDPPAFTLPASTRVHRARTSWPTHRRELFPFCISPHAALPAWMEHHYRAVRRAALLRRREGKQ
ncbi:hypothetical protein DZF91_09440 [Actinomadura logoneensis]|uniref:Uncharacterized protein n=2 Tax=Actinomadura logoneensis TaxID=2293572 RepID=A0A372JR80_9ACTN|nr:hypothetical protein DZF91_09440 [Actinomadura logoneensis]